MRKSLILAAPVCAAMLAFAGVAIGRSVSVHDHSAVTRSVPNTVVGTGGYSGYLTSSNNMIYTTTGGTVSNGVLIIGGAPQSRAPTGSIYHQVVDVYYDGDGNKLATESATHRVDAEYCKPGHRPEPQELIAQDDGKGNVRFASLRLASEPAEAVKPITAEGLVKARLAINRSPATPDQPSEQKQLAAR